MTKLADLKKRLMANPEFRKEYVAADAEFPVVESSIKACTNANPPAREAVISRRAT